MELRQRQWQCRSVVLLFLVVILWEKQSFAGWSQAIFDTGAPDFEELSHPDARGESNVQLLQATTMNRNPRKLREIRNTASYNTSLLPLGFLDENGVLNCNLFETEDVVDVDLNVDVGSGLDNIPSISSGGVKLYKFEVCSPRWKDFIPCLDNSGARERRCPRSGSMCCLVAAPPNYRLPIRWPKSRDEVRYNNVPYAHLLADKGGQNWIKLDRDKYRFPGGDTPFARGAHYYLDQIGKMLPVIGYGSRTRVALDIGCGVATFGAYLFDRNVITLSIALKDAHESQFALERGVPALVASLATRRLLFPSQAFDLIHCSRCEIAWIKDDGIMLLEVDRVLRAGAYFVWSPQLHNNSDKQDNVWKEMESLARRLCWEQIGKDEHLAIWRKSLSNVCYRSRSPDTGPPLCDDNVDPDNTWYVSLQPCITLLPESRFDGGVPEWPARLSSPPSRLETVVMDAGRARAQVFKSDQKYWHTVVASYLRGLGLHREEFRNIMDMRAVYGGFASALVRQKVEWWVMNVVPVSGPNTLPIIYDRGLIGISHDWCEPFDTYPRTYDLLHAVGLFSHEDKRCNIAHIVLEMDRILRPGGWVLVRESNAMATRVQALAKTVRWRTRILETESGPYGKDKLLTCQKPLWHN